MGSAYTGQRRTVVNEPADWLEQLIGQGIRPGLERMQIFVDALEISLGRRWVIVAGTNGKGSTAATLDSILRSAGRSTILYTSPHLVRLSERWIIRGEEVDHAALRSAIERIRTASGELDVLPTFFEALTLIALILADRDDVEIGIFEVGMGGRLDATNVVEADVAAISMIGLDHAEWLGDTIEKIAAEKGGVIKKSTRAVTSNTGASILRVLDELADRAGVTLEALEDCCMIRAKSSDCDGVHFRFTTPLREYDLESPLRGEHQIPNVALAVRAAELLFDRMGLECDAAAIERGVAGTRWRGRLEIFDVDGRRLLVDGAHNPAGAETLARFVERHLQGEVCLLFGCLRDKDWKAMIERLAPLAQKVILTSVDSDRAAEPGEIATWLSERYGVDVVEPASAALDQAWRSGCQNVVVGGSLYLAGDAVAFGDRLRGSR